jgi:hypothetical protein
MGLTRMQSVVFTKQIRVKINVMDNYINTNGDIQTRNLLAIKIIVSRNFTFCTIHLIFLES